MGFNCLTLFYVNMGLPCGLLLWFFHVLSIVSLRKFLFVYRSCSVFSKYNMAATYLFRSLPILCTLSFIILYILYIFHLL